MLSPILVLGVPRSGTSLTAQVVQSWGAYTGDVKPGDTWNPAGYIEYQPISKITNDILGTHFYVQSEHISEEHTQAMREALRSLNQATPTDRPWLLKYPKLSVMRPWLEEIIQDISGVAPYSVVVVRNPLASVESQRRYFEGNLHKRTVETYPYAKALSVWQYYMAYLVGTSRSENTIFVSMEDLVTTGPARLIAWLDQKYATQTDLAQVDVVRKQFVHHQDGNGVLSAQQAELYELLLQIAQDRLAVEDVEWQAYLPNMQDIDELEAWYLDVSKT